MKQPEKFLKKFVSFINSKRLFSRESSLIVAVSGGVDSSVLLHLLKKLHSPWKLQITVVHVNHGLRGKESDQDEKFVQAIAKEYQFPIFSKNVHTNRKSKSRSQNLQEIARKERYQYFLDIKKKVKADLIVTAHTASDSAETILFNFIRGTGIAGISGIPTIRKDMNVVRPLLFAQRKEIEQYAREERIRWRDDSSNLKDMYSRNYIRQKLIPEIERRLNPNVISTLLHEAEVFASISSSLEKQVTKVLLTCVQKQDNGFSINVPLLKRKDLFLQNALVHHILNVAEIEPSYKKIRGIIALMDQQPGKRIILDKSWTAESVTNGIMIMRHSQSAPFSIEVNGIGAFRAEKFSFSIRKEPLPKNILNRDPSIEYVDADRFSFPAVIRSWKYGDAFVPLGMRGVKKISDFFVDAKIPRYQKNMIPIIESKGKIAWVCGIRLDDRFKITKETKHVFQLKIDYTNGIQKDHRQ